MTSDLLGRDDAVALLDVEDREVPQNEAPLITIWGSPDLVDTGAMQPSISYRLRS
jgi:hypothetical protein